MTQTTEEPRNIPQPNLTEIEDGLPKARGCGAIFLFGVITLWVLGLTVLSIGSSWAVEQSLFEGSLPIPDARWVIALVYALAILIPCGLAAYFVKTPRSKLMFRTWALAGVFGLVMVPAKILSLTDAQNVALVQLLAGCGFLYGLSLWIQKKCPAEFSLKSGRVFRGGWSAWLAGALLSIPWALVGSLGSALDVILNLLTAFVFGGGASLIIYSGLLRITTTQERAYRISDLLVDGFGVLITFLILVAGFGQTGTQLGLLTSIPLLSFSVVTLALFGGAISSKPVNWAAGMMLITFATVGPLVFVDPDEVMLVISMGQGELFSWVWQAGWQTLLAVIIIDILSFIFWQRTLEARGYFWVGKVIVALAWVGVALLYMFLGQPGFYGEKLFVVMADQADVSASSTITDIDQRRGDVYARLVQHADRTQAELRAELDRRGISYQPYYLVNGLEVQGGLFLKMWLEGRPDVDRVLSSPHLRPLPEELPISQGESGLPDSEPWNLSMIHADQVWNELRIKGAGVVIGQSDSGVQGDHPELADSYLGRDGHDAYRWYDPWNGSPKPFDFGGHGTHTMGIAAGNRVGVAPDADWIGCVNLARNLGNPAYYLDCWQFMLAPFPQEGDPLRDGDPAQAADILNNSWGCPEVEGCDPLIYQSAVAALRDAGIFVVVSAGNSGTNGCGSVDAPAAIYDDVYTVGSVDAQGNLSEFSSLGPVLVDGSLLTKPDISAPGSGVLSSYPGSTYEIASGTSMAGPHAAGVVALMWSANPKLIGNIALTEEILNRTAQPYQGAYPTCVDGSKVPNNGSGYGILNAYEAVRQALLAQ